MREDTPQTKGQRTAQRILDAAEQQFASRGYDGCTLREIARQAGLQEPGLYNHFRGKLKLYEAVLERALAPMSEVLQRHLQGDEASAALSDLPAQMTDLLLEHPQMAALFQQALHGDPASPGNQLMSRWLGRLLEQGARSMRKAGNHDDDAAETAVRVIAMFNVTTGYFLSQRAFDSMAEGDITSPDNIMRQKQLLRRLSQAMFDV